MSVNGTDRGLRARRSVSTEQPASVGTSPCQPDLTWASAGKAFPWKTFPRKTCLRKTCASNMNSKPWRAAAPGAAAISFACLRHRRDTVPVALSAIGTHVARKAPAVLFFEGIGVACSFRHRRRDFSADGGSKAASALVPGIRGAVAADVPDALTRHNRNLSPSACSS